MTFKHMSFVFWTLLIGLSSTAQAEPRTFDKTSWISLASQTCASQAPNNPQVAALDLSREHLNYSCHCVAKSMLTILPVSERNQLMEQMRTRRNLQQTGQRIFANPDIKKTVASCAASYYWNWSLIGSDFIKLSKNKHLRYHLSARFITKKFL